MAPPRSRRAATQTNKAKAAAEEAAEKEERSKRRREQEASRKAKATAGGTTKPPAKRSKATSSKASGAKTLPQHAKRHLPNSPMPKNLLPKSLLQVEVTVTLRYWVIQVLPHLIQALPLESRFKDKLDTNWRPGSQTSRGIGAFSSFIHINKHPWVVCIL